MADVPHPESDLGSFPPEPGLFRWPAFFQRSREPLFMLNRHRRILFVNRTWEELTGLSATEARKHRCRRGAQGEPGSWEAVARALAPPPEVLAGKPGRARRLFARGQAGLRWWDIDFFPLHDANGLLGILGRISLVREGLEPDPAPLTEELVSLRLQIAQRYGLDQLASTVPALQRVADQVRLASQTHVPVLLVGAPGTGKQWVARTIHHHGLTSPRGFAAVDCARISAAAVASVLFADDGLLSPGRLGTVYLKEPAHLSRDLQARLCDWLISAAAGLDAVDEEAASKGRPAGPRLLAGSSVDPAAEIQAGRLLDDLHCRLGTLVIALPPLCERQADLTDLTERLLHRANGLDERRVVKLTPDAWEFMRAYRWPGNLRELYAVLAGARAHARGEWIEAADLPAYLRQDVNLAREPGPSPPRPLPLDRLLEEAERRLILLALRLARGKHTRAAELLEIPRQRLWRRLKEFGIVADEEDKA